MKYTAIFFLISEQMSCLLEEEVDVVVQSLSHVRLFVTQWTIAHYTFLSFTTSWSLLKLRSIESVMPSNHLILCHPLLFLPSIFPRIRVFSNESALHVRWLKYWNFSISPFKEYSGFIPFRIDWFDLLAVQGRDSQEPSPTPQFKSISFLALSLLYGPALTSAHDYWKNHNFDYTDLCQQSDVSFNMLSMFVIAFLPRNRRFLISWLQSPSAVILEPKKRKSVTASTFPHLFAMKWWDWMPWSQFFECWVLSFKPDFSLSSFTLISLVPLLFLPLAWYHLRIWGCCRQKQELQFHSFQNKNHNHSKKKVWCHIFLEKKRIFSINKNQILILQVRRLEVHMDEVHM